jgi:hypothetical protein
MAATQRARYGGKGSDVGYEEHVAYLKTLGDMSPEIDEHGEFIGLEEDRRRPLEDSTHAFNTYFKEEAAALFAQYGAGRFHQ